MFLSLSFLLYCLPHKRGAEKVITIVDNPPHPASVYGQILKRDKSPPKRSFQLSLNGGFVFLAFYVLAVINCRLIPTALQMPPSIVNSLRLAGSNPVL